MIKRILVFAVHPQGLRGIDVENEIIYSTFHPPVEGLFEFDFVTFEVEKEWTEDDGAYLSGNVLKFQCGTSMLALHAHIFSPEFHLGMFDTDEELEGKDYGPFVYAFHDYGSETFHEDGRDPILESLELDSWDERYTILTKLWEDHPDCIDALVHIGNLRLEKDQFTAAERLFDVALGSAEALIYEGFKGFFPYRHKENRPYLRALYGMGVALWAQNRFKEAIAVIKRGIKRNPDGGMGFERLLKALEKRVPWVEAD